MFQLLRSCIILILRFLILTPILFSASISKSLLMVKRNLLNFDCLSFYLIILVFFLGLYRLFCFKSSIGVSSKLFLLISLIFRILCFCVKHCILFWCFYELSMLPLLYLIFCDSPYSERFLAGWYFASYLIFTSLPLVLLLLYISFTKGSLYFSSWESRSFYFVYLTLSFVFFTKVPLIPFHTWLPIVHAEATRVVSIFLRGYIMKLGLLGVFRCCPFIFKKNFLFYVILCCVFRIFFILTASLELDGKRWLAFLRLSHIVVPFLGLFFRKWDVVSLSFLFCLGHGLRAGLVFGMLWYFYDSSKTRNWLLLKSSIRGKVIMFLLCVRMLSLCSFPPTLQFFCEVMLLSSSSFSLPILAFWVFYLFLGGLVPLILCGHLLTRSECFESNSFRFYRFIHYFLFLLSWCYLGIFIF